MSTMVEETPTVTSEAIGFDKEPIMTKHSHLLGEIALYAPDAPPSMWKELPWKLTTKNGWEGMESDGLVYIVRPEYNLHAFHHTALVEAKHLWPSM